MTRARAPRARHAAARVRVAGRRGIQRVLSRAAWAVLWPGSRPVPIRYPPGHYHSPIPSAVDIDAAVPSGDAVWNPDAVAGIDLRYAAQRALLADLDLEAPSGPRWDDNKFFGAGDAAVYQAILRRFRPPKVIEVGSGWSTAALLDVHTPESLTLVEPYPDRVNKALRPEDWRICRLLRTGLQDVDPALFTTLADGDVLFIDSTHVAKLASDVNHLFTEVLPRLAPGVIVHIHDVMYPFEYPGRWIAQGWAWNEAYVLRAFLQYNDAFEILLWPDMLRCSGDLPGSYGSIWIRRTR